MGHFHACSQKFLLAGSLFILVSCGDPRAVVLPLQYPDGSPVTTRSGQPVMAGYQTYGSAVHSNATALYERATSPTCVTCARVGAVVSEPSVLRQVTGFVGVSATGAGAVMTGIGAMDYGDAAERGKLADNYNQNQNYNSSFTNSNSSSQQQQQQQQQDPGGGFTSGNGGRKFRPGEGSQSTGW